MKCKRYGKPVKVKGYTVYFCKQHNMIWARIPKISSQFLGMGKTKKEAIEDVKDSLELLGK